MIEQIKTWIENNLNWKLKAITPWNELEYVITVYNHLFKQIEELFLQFPILRITIQTQKKCR